MYRLASISTILLTLGLVGCASDKCAESECGDTGASVQALRADTDGDLMALEQARSGWEGTPEGVGLLDFINAVKIVILTGNTDCLFNFVPPFTAHVGSSF